MKIQPSMVFNHCQIRKYDGVQGSGGYSAYTPPKISPKHNFAHKSPIVNKFKHEGPDEQQT